MNPDSGEVYALRESLLEGAELGDRANIEELRSKLQKIDDATDDELEAAQQEQLVRVSEEAACRLKLGAREQDRRRRRRKAGRAARKRNR